MKAQFFRAIIDDRDRVTIPHANVKTIHENKRDWKGAIVEMKIVSVRFPDGSKENFD